MTKPTTRDIIGYIDKLGEEKSKHLTRLYFHLLLNEKNAFQLRDEGVLVHADQRKQEEYSKAFHEWVRRQGEYEKVREEYDKLSNYVIYRAKKERRREEDRKIIQLHNKLKKELKQVETKKRKKGISHTYYRDLLTEFSGKIPFLQETREGRYTANPEIIYAFLRRYSRCEHEYNLYRGEIDRKLFEGKSKSHARWLENAKRVFHSQDKLSFPKTLYDLVFSADSFTTIWHFFGKEPAGDIPTPLEDLEIGLMQGNNHLRYFAFWDLNPEMKKRNIERYLIGISLPSILSRMPYLKYFAGFYEHFDNEVPRPKIDELLGLDTEYQRLTKLTFRERIREVVDFIFDVEDNLFFEFIKADFQEEKYDDIRYDIDNKKDIKVTKQDVYVFLFNRFVESPLFNAFYNANKGRYIGGRMLGDDELYENEITSEWQVKSIRSSLEEDVVSFDILYPWLLEKELRRLLAESESLWEEYEQIESERMLSRGNRESSYTGEVI